MLTDSYHRICNFKTVHSVQYNLNSQPKVHPRVILEIFPSLTTIFLQVFKLKNCWQHCFKVQGCLCCPELSFESSQKTKSSKQPEHLHLCCSWWRGRSFHHVLRAADWPASALASFSMTGRYGTRYAAPSLSRPKCCFSPLLLSFEKTVLHSKVSK